MVAKQCKLTDWTQGQDSQELHAVGIQPQGWGDVYVSQPRKNTNTHATRIWDGRCGAW